jgi:protein-disulfide isomerase
MRRTRLIRPSVLTAIAATLAALSLSAPQATAQTQVPPAPAQSQAAASQEPAAPTPQGAPEFPAPDPQNFTATAPTKETVEAFLQASWGYEENRVWQIEAILKTPAEGVSKVIVYVGDKTGKDKPGALEFFVLPDAKHIVSGDSIVAFGAHPFADARTQLQQNANGPYRGSAAKELELVEFTDFQCPHCKEAQANMEKLVVDFPKARIVFQNDPIAAIHPQSPIAAAYGVCVAKLAGSTAFLQFASSVFDGQDGLATADGATLTLNSAVTKAGLDPQKVAACAAEPATKASVDASVKMAADLGISSVPTLLVNGRAVPANVPYDSLKTIITFQAKLDGITM